MRCRVGLALKRTIAITHCSTACPIAPLRLLSCWTLQSLLRIKKIKKSISQKCGEKIAEKKKWFSLSTTISAIPLSPSRPLPLSP